MLLGHWSNFEDLEEKLSLEELFAILDAIRATEYRKMKFQASLKGIDLDKETGKEQEQEGEYDPTRTRDGRKKEYIPAHQAVDFGIAIQTL